MSVHPQRHPRSAIVQLARQWANGQYHEIRCQRCGKLLARAYEDSQGMLCSTSPTLLHSFNMGQNLRKEAALGGGFRSESTAPPNLDVDQLPLYSKRQRDQIQQARAPKRKVRR